MPISFTLTGNLSNPSEGIVESNNISTQSNSIESVSYSDTLSINGDKWVLDTTSSITVSGLEQVPTTISVAQYILPLTAEFDFTIDLDTTLLNQSNLQYISIYEDSTSNEIKFGVESDSAGTTISPYTTLTYFNTYTEPVGTIQLRVIKNKTEIYLYYYDGSQWQIVSSDSFQWLSSNSLKMRLVTENVSTNPTTVYWENLSFQNSVQYSIPAIWRSKPVGDHLTIPPLTPLQYDLISWKTIEVDNVPQHGILYCQCSTDIINPLTYVPNPISPAFLGPLVQFQQVGPVWQADISSLNLTSKFLCVRLIMGYSSVPYQDRKQYDQYIYNLTSVPYLDVTLDYIPLMNDLVITEQGLTQSQIMDWEYLDTRTVRIKSLISNSIEPDTHIHILYQIPRV